MIEDNVLINVKNRNNGTTGYVLPESNTHRNFAPQETKKIPMSELRSLQYSPGGAYILDNFLIIEDKQALEELNMKVEPEYFYDEAKIKELLFGVNNMDEFLDFLDFATEGAIEIAKDMAVKDKLPDTNKRKALSKKTGFNIDNAIYVNEVMDAEDEDKTKEEPKKERRVKTTETEAPKRRVAAPETPQYKVVSK